MPEVSVTIGGRSFQLACNAGEEPQLQAAAELLNVETAALAGQSGRLTESRMLLMAGLMLADRYTESEKQMQFAADRIGRLEEQLRTAESKIGSLMEVAPKAFPGAETLKSYEDAVIELERLADKLEA